MKKLMEWYKQGIQFVTVDIWDLEHTKVKSRDMWLIKLLKILFISVRGFFVDKVSMRASALTYYTLIAVVPVVAMLIGIAKGFGLHEYLVNMLHNSFEDQEQVLEFLLKFADSMLGRASGGWVTGLSAVFLLWAIISLLNNIEVSFNHIWQVKRNRPWMRKFTDYLSVMLIAPIFLIVSSSITVALHARMLSIANDLGVYSYVAPLVKLGFKSLSYVLLWLMFTFVYVAMPYTKVKFLPALMAGIVAGTLFHFTQNFYIYSQVMVSKYNAIYGSFAALPLFLIWAQISWLILLFGAEMSFAAQNVEHYEMGTDTKNLSMRSRKQLALLTMQHIVKNFAQGKPAMTSSQLANALGTPIRLVRDTIYELSQCKLITEVVTNDPQENAYMPSSDIHLTTVNQIVEQMETLGNLKLNTHKNSASQQVATGITDIANAGSQSGFGQTKIMDI